MTSATRLDHFIQRLVMPLIFAFTILAYIVTPILALTWAQRPFMGATIEQTGVVNQTTGQNWAAQSMGLPFAAHIVRVDDQAVQDAQAIRAIIESKSIGDKISVEYVLQDGSPGRLANIPLQAFPLEDLLTNFWLPYLLGTGYLALGLWTFRARGETRATRTFATFCCGVALILGLFFDMNTTHYLVRIWTAAMPLTGAALVSLAVLFPEQIPLIDRYPRLRFFPYLPSSLVALYAEIVLFDQVDPFAYFVGWRWCYFAIACGIVPMVVTAIYRQRRSRTLLAQQQARIIVWGSAVAFGPVALWTMQATLGLFIPFSAGIFFPPLIAFPLAIAYAIVRYQLLDVDRIISQGLGYTVSTTIVVGGYLLIVNFLGLVFRLQLGAADPVPLAIFVFLLVIGLNPLRARIQRTIDRVFFRDRVDYRTALETFSHELTGTLDLGSILQKVRSNLQATLHPDRILTHLYDEESRSYFEVSDDEFEAPTLGIESALAQRLIRDNHVLYLMPNTALPIDLQADHDQLQALGTPVFVPLRSRDQLTGWLSLGHKRSGRPYQSDDLSFLAAFGNQTAVAIENARLFENVRRNLTAITSMKNLMDNVFASIPSGVITTDINDRITLFNRAAEDILGIPAESILGLPFSRLTPLSLSLNALVRRVLDQQIMLAEEVISELPLRGEVSLQMRASPLRDNRDATLGVAIVVEDLTAQRRLEAVRDMFRRYLSPAIVDNLPTDPAKLKLGGQRRTISILFADIRGFTQFSEQHDPVELVEILNQYLGLAAEKILAEEGTLDKFLGDAVMGLFNTPLDQPDHVLRAVRAAVAMRDALEAHALNMPAEFRLNYGIGLNTGDAVVGNVGTAQRLDYTAIGDSVNYAKRLQENARGGQILISQVVYDQIKDHVEANELESLQVKGRSTPERVYELVRLK
jgi:PAS domain S-box-containing protein